MAYHVLNRAYHVLKIGISRTLHWHMKDYSQGISCTQHWHMSTIKTRRARGSSARRSPCASITAHDNEHDNSNSSSSSSSTTTNNNNKKDYDNNDSNNDSDDIMIVIVIVIVMLMIVINIARGHVGRLRLGAPLRGRRGRGRAEVVLI